MAVVLGWLPQPLGGLLLIQQSFFDSFYRFITADAAGRQEYGGYEFAGTGYIPGGRNALVRTFLDTTDADYLLQLDWDITFTPEDVYAILDAADDPMKVVTGTYVTWFGDDNTLRPCWFTDHDGQEYTPAPEFRAGEIVPLTVAGMGFTIMHRELLLRMERASNDDPWAWFGHDVINQNRVGEDLTFCKRARQVGATIWGHGGVQLGHTKFKTLYPVDMAGGSIFATSIPTPDLPVDKAVLNIGGASKRIPLPDVYAKWRHVLLDIEEGPDVDLVMDARTLAESTTLADSFEAVYCSHTLEHFTEEETPDVLAGFLHVLQPGGVAEIHVPDGDEIDRLVDEVGLHGVAYQSEIGPITPYDMIHGHQASIEAGFPHMAHQQVLTATTLQKVLEEVGFVDVTVIAESFNLLAFAKAPETGGS